MGGTFTERYNSPSAGQNLSDGKSWAIQKSPCRVVAIGFVGGADEHDGHILVYYGQELIADLYSNDDGDSITDSANGRRFWHFISSNKRLRPGDQLNIEVVSAAAAYYTLWLDIREG